MLKAFCLGVASAIVLALTSVVLARPLQYDLVLPPVADPDSFLADEGPVRSERSANISHILGVSRKIYIIMNRIGFFLQITPDGSVSGTEQDNDYTIFQRAALNNSKIKIQGIATCNFLCMDRCGLLYGSREFTDECIFNEVMEDHFFNSYTSAKYSNDKRTLYLALNKKGIPRKVQTKPNASLDKLETYTNVLTKAVPAERVEALETKIYNARLLFGKFLLGSRDDVGGQHALRHHRYHQLCVNAPMTKSEDKNKFRCRKREKRKKKRKCREDEEEGEECHHVPKKKQKSLGKCEEGEEEDECQRRLHMIRKKRKSRNGGGGGEPDIPEKDKKRKKRLKKKFSEKSKTVKYKCESGEGCGKRLEEGRGQKEAEAERAAALDDYDADAFTDGPDLEDDAAMDYDWTTSAAVQD